MIVVKGGVSTWKYTLREAACAQGGSTDVQGYVAGGVSGSRSVRGLVGYEREGRRIESQSYATGSVSGGDNVGGLVGYQGSSSVSNSYWDSYTTGQSAGIGAQNGTVTNLSAVTSDPAQSGAANYAFKIGRAHV